MAHASCSHCHQSAEVTVYPRINTALDPELKQRVKDGSLFVWECPYCGTRNLLRYETLYHDPAARLMIWLLPGTQLPPSQVEDAVKQLEGYTLRLVRESGDLVEKLNLSDAGLEDTVMEMCKWVTREELSEKDPSMADIRLRFLRMEGPDNNLVLAFASQGQMKLVTVGFNVYEDARAILSRNPSVRPDEGFACVDSAWISRFFG